MIEINLTPILLASLPVTGSTDGCDEVRGASAKTRREIEEQLSLINDISFLTGLEKRIEKYYEAITSFPKKITSGLSDGEANAKMEEIRRIVFTSAVSALASQKSKSWYFSLKDFTDIGISADVVANLVTAGYLKKITTGPNKNKYLLLPKFNGDIEIFKQEVIKVNGSISPQLLGTIFNILIQPQIAELTAKVVDALKKNELFSSAGTLSTASLAGLSRTLRTKLVALLQLKLVGSGRSQKYVFDSFAYTDKESFRTDLLGIGITDTALADRLFGELNIANIKRLKLEEIRANLKDAFAEGDISQALRNSSLDNDKSVQVADKISRIAVWGKSQYEESLSIISDFKTAIDSNATTKIFGTKGQAVVFNLAIDSSSITGLTGVIGELAKVRNALLGALPSQIKDVLDQSSDTLEGRGKKLDCYKATLETQKREGAYDPVELSKAIQAYALRLSPVPVDWTLTLDEWYKFNPWLPQGAVAFSGKYSGLEGWEVSPFAVLDWSGVLGGGNSYYRLTPYFSGNLLTGDKYTAGFSGYYGSNSGLVRGASLNVNYANNALGVGSFRDNGADARGNLQLGIGNSISLMPGFYTRFSGTSAELSTRQYTGSLDFIYKNPEVRIPFTRRSIPFVLDAGVALPYTRFEANNTFSTEPEGYEGYFGFDAHLSAMVGLPGQSTLALNAAYKNLIGEGNDSISAGASFETYVSPGGLLDVVGLRRNILPGDLFLGTGLSYSNKDPNDRNIIGLNGTIGIPFLDLNFGTSRYGLYLDVNPTGGYSFTDGKPYGDIGFSIGLRPRRNDNVLRTVNQVLPESRVSRYVYDLTSSFASGVRSDSRVSDQSLFLPGVIDGINAARVSYIYSTSRVASLRGTLSEQVKASDTEGTTTTEPLTVKKGSWGAYRNKRHIGTSDPRSLFGAKLERYRRSIFDLSVKEGVFGRISARQELVQREQSVNFGDGFLSYGDVTAAKLLDALQAIYTNINLGALWDAGLSSYWSGSLEEFESLLKLELFSGYGVGEATWVFAKFVLRDVILAEVSRQEARSASVDRSSVASAKRHVEDAIFGLRELNKEQIDLISAYAWNLVPNGSKPNPTDKLPQNLDLPDLTDLGKIFGLTIVIKPAEPEDDDIAVSAKTLIQSSAFVDETARNKFIDDNWELVGMFIPDSADSAFKTNKEAFKARVSRELLNVKGPYSDRTYPALTALAKARLAYVVSEIGPGGLTDAVKKAIKEAPLTEGLLKLIVSIGAKDKPEIEFDLTLYNQIMAALGKKDLQYTAAFDSLDFLKGVEGKYLTKKAFNKWLEANPELKDKFFTQKGASLELANPSFEWVSRRTSYAIKDAQVDPKKLKASLSGELIQHTIDAFKDLIVEWGESFWTEIASLYGDQSKIYAKIRESGLTPDPVVVGYIDRAIKTKDAQSKYLIMFLHRCFWFKTATRILGGTWKVGQNNVKILKPGNSYRVERDGKGFIVKIDSKGNIIIGRFDSSSTADYITPDTAGVMNKELFKLLGFDISKDASGQKNSISIANDILGAMAVLGKSGGEQTIQGNINGTPSTVKVTVSKLGTTLGTTTAIPSAPGGSSTAGGSASTGDAGRTATASPVPVPTTSSPITVDVSYLADNKLGRFVQRISGIVTTAAQAIGTSAKSYLTVKYTMVLSISNESGTIVARLKELKIDDANLNLEANTKITARRMEIDKSDLDALRGKVSILPAELKPGGSLTIEINLMPELQIRF